MRLGPWPNSLLVCVHRGKTMWGYSGKKTAICKPGTNPVSALILDFQPLEWRKNKVLLLKPLSLWNSVRQPELIGQSVVVFATPAPSGSAVIPEQRRKAKRVGEGEVITKQKGDRMEREERRGEGFLEAGGSAWHIIAAQQSLRWMDWEIDSWMSLSCVPVMNFSQCQVLGVASQIAGRQLMIAASA